MGTKCMWEQQNKIIDVHDAHVGIYPKVCVAS
jgi:hypothetical protein